MSKRADRLHALQGMGEDELAEHLREQRRKLLEVRFQQATGQVENHRQIRLLRQEIAQALTLQAQARRGGAAVAAADAAWEEV